MVSRILIILCGNIAKSTFEPSRGGRGIILNTSNIIFIFTINNEIRIKGIFNDEAGRTLKPYLTNNPKNKAINKFDAGPAIEIRNSPHLLFFTLYGFHIMGFAHPKVKPKKDVIIGTITEPNISRCFKGFNVNLPCNLGVGSPSNSAV